MDDTENPTPTDPIDDTSPDSPDQPSASRGWLLVVIVVVLLVYPAARWMLNRGSAAGAPGGAPANGVSLQLSMEHYQAGRYQDAINAAQAVLAAYPNTAEAYNNMAVSYLGLKKYDEAIAAAQEALRLKPDMQLAKNNLAWIQSEKIKSLRPDLPPDAAAKVAQLLNQSLAQTQAKQYKECAASALAATKLDPYSAGAFNNLGFCQALMGQWDEGIKSAEAAIKIDTTMQLAKNNLAWMKQEAAKAKK